MNKLIGFNLLIDFAWLVYIVYFDHKERINASLGGIIRVWLMFVLATALLTGGIYFTSI